MTLIKRKKFFLYLWLLIFLIGIGYLIFNANGLIKYSKISNEVDSLKAHIIHVENENEMLRNEIDSLRKNIPAKIEKVAREKYGMKRANEIRIEIDEKEDEE